MRCELDGKGVGLSGFVLVLTVITAAKRGEDDSAAIQPSQPNSDGEGCETELVSIAGFLHVRGNVSCRLIPDIQGDLHETSRKAGE